MTDGHINEKQFDELKKSLSSINSTLLLACFVLLLMFLFSQCSNSENKKAVTSSARDISGELYRIHSDLEGLNSGISRFANFRTQLSPNSCPDCNCSCPNR